MTMSEANAPVSENISKIIKKKGLVQAYVAKKAGYTPQSLCDMINGRKIIKPYDVVKISRVLQVDANELFL